MRYVLVALVAGLVLGGAANGAWEDNQCVQCHEKEVLPITLGHTFADWRASAHARGGVACEKCHGGDPRATTAEAAHRGVLPAADPKSLVHPTHLPATCGACHEKEYEAFKGTVHDRELREKGTGGSCFTCHEAMATSFPTPRELNARCSECHDKPVDVQAAVAMIAMTKRQLYRSRKAMETAKSVNPTWHQSALDRFHEMERTYREVQLAWHRFETRKVLRDSHDLVKLGQALADEAEVMSHRGAK